MPIELTLPITAVSALALAAALTFTGWLPLPRVRLRAQNEKHGPLRVIELALVMSPALARTAGGRPVAAGDRVRRLHHPEDL